jgi:hypothetical protein
MTWIDVEDRLPNDGQFVLIHVGNYERSQFDIVQFIRGLSVDEREEMKGSNHIVTVSNRDPITYKTKYEYVKRWEVFRAEDEHGNNKKPYYWSHPPMQYFGQFVTHWMLLPETPKLEEI